MEQAGRAVARRLCSKALDGKGPQLHRHGGASTRPPSPRACMMVERACMRRRGSWMPRRSVGSSYSSVMSWGGGALALGRRSFVGSELNVEALEDPLSDQALRRISLLVSLGTR